MQRGALSSGAKQDETVLWETSEGFTVLFCQPLNQFLSTEGVKREEKRGGLAGEGKAEWKKEVRRANLKMLSARPEDSGDFRSRRRLSLLIMQHTYVPPHVFIHFSATSDMEDLHLGFPFIFSDSRLSSEITHACRAVAPVGRCELPAWLLWRLNLTDAEGTRSDFPCQAQTHHKLVCDRLNTIKQPWSQ